MGLSDWKSEKFFRVRIACFHVKVNGGLLTGADDEL